MLCARPLRLADDSLVPCGQCRNCRINRRRIWTGRLLLEGLSCEAYHGHVSWVTLTYADHAVPLSARGGGEILPTLNPHDLGRLWRRLRKAHGPFRYFAVGEYGDHTQRPHYHALIFSRLEPFTVEHFLQGYWEQQFGHTRTRPWSLPESHGGVGRVGEDVRAARAAYCAAYCVKKMNAEHVDLGPRHPEFSRCSRMPGIGHTPYLLELMHTKGAAWSIAENGDVPNAVSIGPKSYPLGQKTRAWLREQMGLPATVPERAEVLAPLVVPPQRTEDDYRRAAAYCAKMEAQATPRGSL